MKNKSLMPLLMIIILLLQVLPASAQAESVLESRLVIGADDKMHHVTFQDADGNLLDEMSVRNGTDVSGLAGQLAGSLEGTWAWRSTSQSTLKNVITDTLFIAEYAELTLFGEEALLSVASPKPGLLIYDDKNELLENNSTITPTMPLTLRLRFEVTVSSRISAGIIYTYPLPEALVDRNGDVRVFTHNGIKFGEAWIEDATFMVIFTEDAASYSGASFIFGYECTQRLNVEYVKESEKIPESIAVQINDEDITILIVDEIGRPTIKSKSVEYTAKDSQYVDEPFVLNWTITVEPYTRDGIAVPMPATIEDTFVLDVSSEQHKAATEQEYVEGSMVVRVGDRVLTSGEYALAVRADNSGFTLDLPEFDETVVITYTTRVANGWADLLATKGMLIYTNKAQLAENGEPVGDEVAASYYYYPNYLSKSFSSIEQTADCYRVTWDIQIMGDTYTKPFFPSMTVMEDILPDGVRFIGLYDRNGISISQERPSETDRNAVYYQLDGQKLTVHFPNGMDGDILLKLVVEYPIGWSEAISNTATLIVPGEGDVSSTANIGTESSAILKRSLGFDRRTGMFQWRVTIFAGNGLQGVYFRDYPNYWDDIYRGDEPAFSGMARFARITGISGTDMNGSPLSLETILSTQHEYPAKKGGTCTEFFLGDIKGVVMIELETELDDQLKHRRSFCNTAALFDARQKEYRSPACFFLEEDTYSKYFLNRDEALKEFPDLAEDEVAWLIEATFENMDEIRIQDELGPNLKFSTKAHHYRSMFANDWHGLVNSSYVSDVSGGPGETTLAFSVRKPQDMDAFKLYFVTKVDTGAMTGVSGELHVNNKVTFFGDGLPEEGVDRNASGTITFATMNKKAEIQPGYAKWIITINPDQATDFVPESFEKVTLTDVLNPNLRLDHGKADVSLSDEAGNPVDFDFYYDPSPTGNTVKIEFDTSKLNGHTLTCTIDTTVLANFKTKNDVTLSADGFTLVETTSPVYSLEKDAAAYIETNTYLNIEKVDEYDDTIKLQGVGFALYLPDGNLPIAFSTTDSDGKLTFKNLDYQAQYILVEYGIDGYHWLDGTIGGHSHAMLVFPGAVNFITTITNRPVTGRFAIAKVDAEDSTPLEGATFTLYKGGVKIDEQVTDEQGSVTFEKLRPGIYTLKETFPPAGYDLSEIEWVVKVLAVEKEAVVTITENDGDDLMVQGVLTVINQPMQEKVTIKGQKTWIDGIATHISRDEVTLRLERKLKNLPDVEENWEEITGVIAAWEGDTYTFPSQAKYNAVREEYEYRIVEMPIYGFETTYDGYDITNTRIADPSPSPSPIITPSPSPIVTPSPSPSTGEYVMPRMGDLSELTAEEMEYVTEQYVVDEAWVADDEVIDLHMETEPATILPQYEALYERNSDMVGWIKIDGILVDYPVMQSPGDIEFYLHRDFEKEYSYSGLPFMDDRCDINEPTNNLLIYGHNMKNGTMFGQLPKFKSKNFWEKHRTIQMDLLYETRTYEIVSVFLSRQYKKGQKGFRYYDYIDLSDRDRFAEYIEQVKKASLFDTGVSANWGDNILTLSTCSYHVDAGTLVVVARYQP